MSSENYLKDIIEIKSIMNRSTKFLSLSGVSGILAGIYALVGAYVAYELIENYLSHFLDADFLSADKFQYLFKLRIQLIVVAFCVLLASVSTGFYFTYRKAKKNSESIWNELTRKLIFDFCIPLFTGGIFCLILISKGYYSIIAPATLIFYGMALYGASKYTIGTIKYLGISEIVLGLIALNFIGYGILFWSIGFGILHILYGILFYYKHDRKEVQ